MSNTKLKVISSDGKEFEIDYDIAKQSTKLKLLFEEDIDEPISLPYIKASILKPIIDFCNHHKNDPEVASIDDDDDSDDDDNDSTNKNNRDPKKIYTISEWDHKFVQQFTTREDTLFDIISAVNYLDIKPLLRIVCKTVIHMIRGKSSAEIQEMFKFAGTSDEIVDDLIANDDADILKTDSKKK